MTTAKQNSKRKKGKRKEKQRKGKDIESRKEERSVVYRGLGNSNKGALEIGLMR